MFTSEMRKRVNRELKKPGGIALRPSLWARIDELADAQDKSRNQVMEEVLSLHLPSLAGSRNSHEDTRESETNLELPDGN